MHNGCCRQTELEGDALQAPKTYSRWQEAQEHLAAERHWELGHNRFFVDLFVADPDLCWKDSRDNTCQARLWKCRVKSGEPTRGSGVRTGRTSALLARLLLLDRAQSQHGAPTCIVGAYLLAQRSRQLGIVHVRLRKLASPQLPGAQAKKKHIPAQQ